VRDRDPALSSALDRLVPPAVATPDWPDVLDRAGVRRRAPRTATVAVVLAGLALLAAPALGLRGHLRTLLGGAERPQLRFAADLRPTSGHGSGSFVTAPLRIFRPVGSKRVVGFTQTLGFTLRFRGLSGPATAARLRIAPPRRSGGTGSTVLLCSPCRSGRVGILRRRGLILVLMTGRGTVEIATAHHPDGELRGVVRPSRRR
jgi:hypothetical protein